MNADIIYDSLWVISLLSALTNVENHFFKGIMVDNLTGAHLSLISCSGLQSQLKCVSAVQAALRVTAADWSGPGSPQK